MAEIVWLLEENVRAVHGRQLSEHGGRPGIRDEGLLLSALARPQNLAAYADPSHGVVRHRRSPFHNPVPDQL